MRSRTTYLQPMHVSIDPISSLRTSAFKFGQICVKLEYLSTTFCHQDQHPIRPSHIYLTSEYPRARDTISMVCRVERGVTRAALECFASLDAPRRTPIHMDFQNPQQGGISKKKEPRLSLVWATATRDHTRRPHDSEFCEGVFWNRTQTALVRSNHISVQGARS